MKMNDYNEKHLCGSPYDEDERCEYLIYATNEGMKIGKKELKRFHVYCTAESRLRSMGCMAGWTGLSPKWCPKRRKIVDGED